MSYLLDARALQSESSKRGIGTYVRGLLTGMRELDMDQHFQLLLRRDAPPPPELRQLKAKIAPTKLFGMKRRIQPVVDPFYIAWTLRSLKPTLYHSPDYAQPIVASCPVVITVHDLIPFVFPDMYPWLRRERLLALQLLRNADALIADSEATAHDLVRLAHVRGERVHVVPLAVDANREPISEDEIERVRSKYSLPRPFLLAVGAFDPRKRIDHVAEITARVRARHDVDLVVVGQQGKFTGTVANAINNAGLAGHAHQLGFVPSKDLAALYASCACLLFTSAYEGFGLPPLEAMAAGAPVAMYNNSSLREIAGDAAMVARDGVSSELSAQIVELLGNADQRQHRVERGQHWARRFSWSATAEGTLAVYEHVLGNRSKW